MKRPELRKNRQRAGIGRRQRDTLQRQSVAAIAIVAAIVVAWVPVRPAAAFVRTTVDGKPEVYLYWTQRSIAYWIQSAGAPDLTLESVVGAVRRSFDTWAMPTCTDLTLSFAGLTDSTSTNLTLAPSEDRDRRNVVHFQRESWPPPNSSVDLVLPEMLALTVMVFNADTGQIIDADIDLNGVDFAWSTTDQPLERVDVQNVVTHEVGHLLGLGHAPSRSSTMYADQLPGETSKRQLAADDIEGICEIYPAGAPTPLGEGQLEPERVLRGGCVIGEETDRQIPPEFSLIALLFALFWLFRRWRIAHHG